MRCSGGPDKESGELLSYLKQVEVGEKLFDLRSTLSLIFVVNMHVDSCFEGSIELVQRFSSDEICLGGNW